MYSAQIRMVVAHPSLAPSARNPLLVPIMRSVMDSRENPSVHTAKKPDRTPREVGLTYH